MKKYYTLLLISIFAGIMSWSQTLDPTFGTGGQAGPFFYNNFSSTNMEKAMALQPDGKILIAGYQYNGSNYDFAVMRLNADGTIDNSFDGDGLKSINITNNNDYAYAVAVQPDGKILLTGYSYYYTTYTCCSGGWGGGCSTCYSYYYSIVVVRLNSDGTPDNTFDGDGIRIFDFSGGGEYAYSIAVQQDGKIIIAGYANGALVARLNTNGSLDVSFNGSGYNINTFSYELFSVAVQTDGKIVVAGQGFQNGGYGFAVARYNSNGTFDNSFDGDGRKIINLETSGEASAYSIAIQPDSKLIIAGRSYNYNNPATYFDYGVIRLNVDGSMDNSFDGDGKRVIDFNNSNNYDEAKAIALQNDGKIIVSGMAYTGSNYDIGLIRINTDGTLDNSFDSDGKFTYGANNSEYGNSLVFQTDGKLLVGSFVGGPGAIRLLLDEIPATLSCPENVITTTDEGLCTAIINDIDPIVSPSNATINYSIEYNGSVLETGTGSVSGKSFGLGVSTITYTVGNDESVSCSFTVTITDDQPPSFTCPTDRNVNLSGTCQLVVPDLIEGLTGTDNCGTVTFTQSPIASTALSSSHNQTHNVVVTANDGNGNSQTCTVVLTGKDVTKPLFTCPLNQNINLNGTCQLVVPDLIGGLTGSDNCGTVNFTQSPVASTALSSSHNQTHNVVITANDGNGNSQTCAVVLTGKDVTKPTFTCPLNQNVNLNGTCQLVVPDLIGGLTGSDNCGTVTFSQSPVAATVLSSSHNQMHNVIITSNDGNGNSQTCTVALTGKDVSKPTFTCPLNQNVNLNGTCQLVVPDLIGGLTGSDNCGAVTFTQSPVASTALSSSHNQTHNVVITANDGNGNSQTCTIVLTGKDVTAPTLTCPANITVSNDEGICGATVSFAATSSDNCSTPVVKYYLNHGTPQQQEISSPRVFAVGTHTIKAVSTDPSGNSNNCSFTVTVDDDENPVFGTANSNGDAVYLRSSASAPWGLNGNETAMSAVFGAAGWQDKRFETVNTATLFSSSTRFIFMEGGDGTANEMKAFITANKTAIENWVSSGGRLLMNAAPNEGGNIDFGFGGVTLVYPNYTYTGNATVPGHPIFNGPLTPVGTSWTGSYLGHAILTPANANMTKLIHNSDNNLALLVETQWGNGIVMFGGMTLPFFQSSIYGTAWSQPTTGNLHKNILSYLAATGTNQGNITVTSASGQCGAIVTFNTPAATDNCPGLQVSQSQGLTSGSTFPVGTTTNIFLATDGHGNTATYSFTVTVTDAQAPDITQPNNIATGNDPGNCSAQVSFSAQVTDNCTVSSVKYYLNYNTPNQEEIFFPKVFSLGNHSITIVAKDAANNSATRSFTITVNDTEKPTVTKGSIGSCYKTIAAAQTAALDATTYSDNCTPNAQLNVQVATVGTCSAQITVTVTDGANNSRSVTYNTRIDNTSPVLSLTPANVTVNCHEVPSVPTVTANDDCDGSVIVGFTSSSTKGSDPVLNNYYNYAITRKWSASDACGNTVEHIQIITVQDITAPTITCPTDKLSVPFDFGQLYATIAIGSATATDNCAGGSNITIAGTRSDNVAIANQQYPLGTTTVAWSATDPSTNSSGCTQTITVRKRNTLVTYTGEMTDNKVVVQYSDIINLQAKLTDNEGLAVPNNISGRTITFQLLSGTTVLRSKTATTNSGGIAADSFKVEQAPGMYFVKAIFAGDSYFNSSYDQDNCEVKQEDAIVEYNGSQYFTTASSTTMNGTVTLAASINDIDDGSDKRGDIRKAKATFRDGGPAANVLGSANLPVGLVNPGVLTNGLAATTQSYTLNTNEAGSGGKIFQVWVGTSDHYTGADAGPTPVTLALPGQDFVTGGGHLVLTNSAGTYAGTANSKMNFGFTMKWNKSGKSLQGQINIVFRKWQLYNGQWQWRVYQIKSNAINSMAVVEVGSNGQPASSTNPAVFRKAIINTKSNLKDVTDPLNNLDLGGNHNLVLDVWDHITANGGISDKISVMLMASTTNDLLFSSSWTANATVAQTITGGNINVRNGSTGGGTTKNSTDQQPEMEKAETKIKDEFIVRAYPNPSANHFTITISSNLNEAAQIQLYDAAGRKVETINARANEATRFGEKLRAGIYFAKVILGTRTETVKLIKQ